MRESIARVISLLARRSGQSAAEYAIVLAVIVIGIVAAEGALASSIGTTLQNVTAQL